MDHAKEEELRQRLAQHGYKLEKITEFANHDRITFGNSQLKISINLRGKISEFALDALVNACIRKKKTDGISENRNCGKPGIDCPELNQETRLCTYKGGCQWRGKTKTEQATLETQP